MVTYELMPTVNRIRVHPIKSLDSIERRKSTVNRGGLEYDRKYAMFDENDEYVNGKRYEKVHLLRADFDVETEQVTLRVQGEDESSTFEMNSERSDLEAWLTDFFEVEITVVESSDTRFTDAAGGIAPMEISAPGPSIVSTATYREIASWFDDLTVDDVRNRFRSNIEIGGVPPFWEDKLFSDTDHVVTFQIGDVLFRGVMPLPRCVVPTRDPLTGERSGEFVRIFTENREKKFPEWASAEHLGAHLPTRSQHYFYLTVVTRIPNAENGKQLQQGDDVEILGEETVVKSL